MNEASSIQLQPEPFAAAFRQELLAGRDPGYAPSQIASSFAAHSMRPPTRGLLETPCSRELMLADHIDARTAPCGALLSSTRE